MGRGSAAHHRPQAERKAAGVTDEIELVRRAQARDDAAFAELYKRHRQAVTRVASSMVGDADADDVTSRAFETAYFRLDSFTGLGSFQGWLVRIAQNKARDWLRQRIRQQAVDATSIEQQDDDWEQSLADDLHDDDVIPGPRAESRPDEYTSVPADKPSIAACAYLAALAWPETSARGHAQRARCMLAMKHLWIRRGRELGHKLPDRLTMPLQQQRNILAMTRQRLGKRLEALSIAQSCLAAHQQLNLQPWTLGAAARSKTSRTAWYRDTWTASLPVLHLAWKIRGVLRQRGIDCAPKSMTFRIGNGLAVAHEAPQMIGAITDAVLLDLILDASWVAEALADAERLAPILARASRTGEQTPFLKLPAQVRLIPDR